MPNQHDRPFRLIGELMNNSFARARRAWSARSVKDYQHLARLQTENTLGDQDQSRRAS